MDDGQPDEEAVIEALTLTCVIDRYGNKLYYNKEDQLHRIYGPAEVTKLGSKFWYRNGKYHREDGPAIMWYDGNVEFWIDGTQLSELQFIKWQKNNGSENEINI